MTAPFFPIIYVRGYAMTQSEVAATVETPYMGFNLGSTKVRQTWEKKVERHIFESPLIRLMKEFKYLDVYQNGTENKGKLPMKSVIIYRYYEQGDKDLGTGKPPTIIEAAQGLKKLIYEIRDQVCKDDNNLLSKFKVHLVAHSMGGLICRAFLQNKEISSDEDRKLVDKVFTYATPHNGIEMAGINVPSVFSMWDMNNFNRDEMAKYLGFKKTPGRVDSLNGYFDPQRFFCLVGTNHRDYDAALGMSRKLAGEMSDGLVKIENATIQNSPRAFVYKSHSGPYGIVNSEEGYQNLVRFLFGDVRVDGILEVINLPLPPAVKKKYEGGKPVRASYYFEATVTPRGPYDFRLTERRRDTYCAILRTFDEMMKPEKVNLSSPRYPMLFTTFLDRKNIQANETIVFSVDLAITTTDYLVDGLIWKNHIDGEEIYRERITLRAKYYEDKWNLNVVYEDNWSGSIGKKAERNEQRVEQKGTSFLVKLSSTKGFNGVLRLEIKLVN